jgi:hypothetical protein
MQRPSFNEPTTRKRQGSLMTDELVSVTRPNEQEMDCQLVRQNARQDGSLPTAPKESTKIHPAISMSLMDNCCCPIVLSDHQH